MKIFSLTALLLVPFASMLRAQAPAPAKAPAPPTSTGPLLVDVHVSPYHNTIDYTTNISRDRFDMRRATIVDMIQFAYQLGQEDDDQENAAIVGGPTWIDLDRFDVIALIPTLKPAVQNAGPPDPANPPANPNDQVRPVLKRVLAERFHLTYHMEDRPLPGYIVTVAKDGPKFVEAKDPTAKNNCRVDPDKATPDQAMLLCTSETVTQLLSTFGGAFPHAMVDHTGLTKPYDFALKLPGRIQVQTRDELARIYIDAFSKSLGLVVTPGNIPQSAFVVDKVDRTPVPNPPEIAKLIPALPDLEFEVATIRPSPDNETDEQIRASGSQITFSGFQLQDLISRAWQLPTAMMLGKARELLPQTRYTILVKLPPDIDGRAVYQDQDQIASMLQKLLVDRFQIKFHWGEWTQPDAYVLLAGTPKMKKADPNSRSYCKFGPAEGEKTARGATSPFDQEFHCQNVTMAQFADLAQAVAWSEVKNRVPDKTGLAGSYDFSVHYTSGHKLRLDTATASAARPSGDAATAPSAGDSASDPIVSLSVEDAFRKQLGLRLEKQPLVLPAFVLDHYAQTPTEN